MLTTPRTAMNAWHHSRNVVRLGRVTVISLDFRWRRYGVDVGLFDHPVEDEGVDDFGGSKRGFVGWERHRRDPTLRAVDGVLDEVDGSGAMRIDRAGRARGEEGHVVFLQYGLRGRRWMRSGPG